MSIDSEDSPLEQALRADLPSDETAARLRRKLLAAGIAVGTGTAAGSAAAAGAAPSLLATAGAKLAAVSWGVKLGFAAAVTIPTVGLLVEHAQQPVAVIATPAAPQQTSAAVRLPDPPVVAAPLPTTEPPPEPVREVRPSARPAPVVAAEATRLEPALPVPTPAPAPAPPAPASPSRVAFEGDPPASPSLASSSTLAEETRLLDAAFAELSAGNREQARRLIREHETRFPAGLLRRERERAKARLSEVTGD